MEVIELIRRINLLFDKALYYENICNNEITNESLSQAKELLDEYLKK